MLIQSKTATRPATRRSGPSSSTSPATLGTFPQVTEAQVAAPSRATRTRSRRTATRRWCTFSPKGTYDEAALYIETIEAAVDKVQKRHAGFYVDELGSVSTEQGDRCAAFTEHAREGRR